ncbi:hypothetical protein J2X57_001999 [Luteibacter sp. 1214]|uniref:hypothetical protein n=1 Tax=Luteibacter sp. 1214 TaxID=2817735 RepID=UPI00285AA3BE|nr:hypothetical protein [Luteibacter sp. 1214]MDR6642787.1 hypothetical protein [Luteibacter sp. 1214]
MHTCSSSSAPVARVVAHMRTRHGGRAIIKHAGAHYLPCAAIATELHADPALLMQRMSGHTDAFGIANLTVAPYEVNGKLFALSESAVVAAIPLDRLLVFLMTIHVFPLCDSTELARELAREFANVVRKAISLYPDDPRGVPAAPTSPPDASGTPEKRVLMLQIELDGGIDLPPNEVIGEALIKTLGAVLGASQPTAAPTRH